MAKIILAGGSGTLGNMLCAAFRDEDNEIIVLTRQDMKRHHPHVDFVHWDGKSMGDWCKELEGADYVINLSGSNIKTRFTEKNKELLVRSRIEPTKVLGEAIAKAENPPRVWMNFSGISIYNNAPTLQDETGTQYADDFMSSIVKKWEGTFLEAKTPRTEKVILRMSPILSKGSGMFPELYPITKLGLGGPVGDGKQLVSWIHEDDFVGLLTWLISLEKHEAIYHLCSPNPVTNAEFMAALRKAAGAKFGLPLPAFMAKIGSAVKGMDPSLILDSVPVTTILTLKNGYTFKFPYIQPAFNQLVKSST